MSLLNTRMRLGRRVMLGTALVILAALFLVSNAAWAKGDNAFTLNQAIDLALKRNPKVEQAVHSIYKARAALNEARTAFFPTLSATYSATYLSERPHSISPPTAISPGGRRNQGTHDVYTLSVSATQILFSGGQILNTFRKAGVGVDIAKMAYELSRHEIVLAVKQAYFEILRAKEAVVVARQTVRQLQAQVKVSRNFYRVGMVPKNDVLKTQVTHAEAVQNLYKARNAVKVAKSALNILLRRDVDAPIRLTDPLRYRPTHYRLRESYVLGLRNRPEIKQLGLQIVSARRDIGIAKSGYFPTVSLTGTYNKYGDDPALGASRFQSADDWNIVLAFTWNFWEWGKTTYQVRQAYREHSRLLAYQKQIVDELRLDIKKAYLDLKLAEKNIFVAKTSVAQAKENYRMAVARYREQVTTSTEVLDAQTLLFSAQTNYFNALADYNIAVAKLRRAMGMLR